MGQSCTRAARLSNAAPRLAVYLGFTLHVDPLKEALPMRARSKAVTTLVLALAVLVGWTAFHLELNGSFPEADATVAESPAEIWLEFSVAPDMARTSFSVRGPVGNVELGEVVNGAKPEVVKAAVKGPMPAGTYTVSWAGAPANDHVVRGRFTFTVQADRRDRRPVSGSRK